MITGATLAAAVTLTLNVPLVEPALLVAVKVRLFVPTTVLEEGLKTATPLLLKVAQPGQVPVLVKTGVGFPPKLMVLVTVVPAWTVTGMGFVVRVGAEVAAGALSAT